ncbi:hypothetical protein IAT38_002996 [Cryptococcus sp. DSM 104549]
MTGDPRRIALSDPLLSHPPRFVVGGQLSQMVSGDIKMYEWRRDVGEMRMLGLQTEVGQIRTLAWSPHQVHRHIVAAGLSNGRTLILPLSPSSLSIPSGDPPVPTIAALTVKHSRAVTSISFSPHDPNYLATGLDRHRSEFSLLIWDISEATDLARLAVDGDESWQRPPETSRLRVTTSLPALKTPSASEPRYIQQYCPSEQVHSVAFIPRTTHQLLASAGNKHLRLYDLRAPAPGSTGHGGLGSNAAAMAGAVVQWTTRAVNALTPNPVQEHLFASYESMPGAKESTARLWDTRHTNGEVLSFEQPGAVVGMQWLGGSKLGVGTKENGVRLWDVVNGKKVEDGAVVNEWVTLGGMRQIVRPRPNLHSFSFAASEKGEGDIMYVLKDGTISVGPIGSAPIIAYSTRGEVAIATPSLRILDPDSTSAPATAPTSGLPAPPPMPDPDDTDRPRRVNRFQLAPDRITKLLAERSRSASPIPGGAGSATGSGLVHSFLNLERLWYQGGGNVERLVDEHDQFAGGWEGGRRALGSDVAVVMRRRALEGYGLDDLLLNAAIATRHPGKEKLAGVWEFIDHLTHAMSPSLSTTRGYNLTHLGIYPIWTASGVSSDTLTVSSPDSTRSNATLQDSQNQKSEPTPAWAALSQQIPFPYSSRASSIHSTSAAPQTPRERKASDRPSLAPVELDPAYLSAVQGLNSHRSEMGGVGKPGVVRAALGGSRKELRKLILTVCGENGEGGKDEMDRLVAVGERTKAAYRAFFAGDEAGTVGILMASEDQHHRLLGSTIAGFMSQSASARGSEFFNSHWHSLVNKVDDPFVRAVLSRIGGEDWESVLQEEGIPLLDRIAVGVQHLDDRELTTFLRGRMNRFTRSSSLHMLALSGLSPPALSLLERYLERTGDLQTVAILSAFFPSSKLNAAEKKRVERWREGYRDLLDSWGLWGERCEFDVRWGEVARRLGGGGDAEVESKNGSCPVCNNPLSKDTETRLHRKNAVRGTPTVGLPSERTTACMYCQTPLPRCVVCLLHVDPYRPPTTDIEGPDHITDTIDAAYVFCLTCRHGGHANHILPWFEGGLDGGIPHSVCPVAGCECECATV